MVYYIIVNGKNKIFFLHPYQSRGQIAESERISIGPLCYKYWYSPATQMKTMKNYETFRKGQELGYILLN
jgi:hypothetical protein